MTTQNDVDDVPRVESGFAQSVRRVLIAEDQAEHAAWLQEALKSLRPRWEVVAKVSNVKQLRAMIEELAPDTLLLDVHLLDGNSLEALQDLPYPMPIVFTSGDPAFAINAFEHAAVDYLLKPVRMSRLEQALRRVEQTRVSLPASEDSVDSGLKWFTAHRGPNLAIIQVGDVLYLQSQTKYTRIVTADGEALLKRGLGQFEQQLDRRRFCRIHRSTVINIECAKTLQRDDLGRLKVQMRGRSEWLYVSKPFERLFRQA